MAEPFQHTPGARELADRQERSLSIQACYNDAEWRLILQGPTLATLWMIQADIYSTEVTRQKMRTGVAAMFDSAGAADAGELVGAVVDALLSGQRPADMPERPRNLAEARRIVLGCCRRLAALLDQKTPHAEAAAYVRWLLQIGARVAQVADAQRPPSPGDQRIISHALDQLETTLLRGA